MANKRTPATAGWFCLLTQSRSPEMRLSFCGKKRWMTRNTQGRASAPTMMVSKAMLKVPICHPDPLRTQRAVCPREKPVVRPRSARLLQVGQILLQLRYVKAARRGELTAFLFQKVRAENRIGLIAV